MFAKSLASLPVSFLSRAQLFLLFRSDEIDGGRQPMLCRTLSAGSRSRLWHHALALCGNAQLRADRPQTAHEPVASTLNGTLMTCAMTSAPTKASYRRSPIYRLRANDSTGQRFLAHLTIVAPD